MWWVEVYIAGAALSAALFWYADKRWVDRTGDPNIGWSGALLAVLLWPAMWLGLPLFMLYENRRGIQ